MPNPKRHNRLWFHESTQRWLCRWAVVLFGVLPLIFSLAFLLVTQSTWYQLRQAAAWRERIRNNLGLDVVFEKIEFPSPNRFRISGLVCAHPETQKPVLYVESLDGFIARGGWGMEFGKTIVRQAQTDLALSILHDSFLCRPHNMVPLLKLSIPELVVEAPIAPSHSVSTSRYQVLTQLKDVAIEYSPSLDRSDLKVQFRTSTETATGGTKPALLHVMRYHAVESPITEWALDSSDVAIPCWPLSYHLPGIDKLGEGCLFRGIVRASCDVKGWSCSFGGAFSNVDWKSATSYLGSPIQGVGGELIIRDARFVNHRLQVASGRMRNVESVRNDWIQRQIAHSGWVTSNQSPWIGKEWLTSKAWDMEFKLDSQGLQWIGQLEEINGASNGQRYRLAAMLEGVHVATQLVESERVIPIDQLGKWAAITATGSDSIASQMQNELNDFLPAPPTTTRMSGPIRPLR